MRGSNENPQSIEARLEAMEKQLARLTSRSATPQNQATAFIVRQAAHGFTLGQPLRLAGGSLVLAQADTATNAQWVGVVGLVINADAFILVLPGSLLTGLTGRIAGARYYLDATTAGAVTTTAPTISAPIYDAMPDTTSAILCAGAGGSGAIAPTEDGTVFCSKSDLTGEWTLVVDIGRNVAGKAGKIQILSPNASGVAIELDAALVTASTKKLTIRELDICEGGTEKKMMVLGSAPY